MQIACQETGKAEGFLTMQTTLAGPGANVVTSAKIDGKPVVVRLIAYILKGEAEVVKAELA